ncbi:MAG: hypothetical protein CMF62_00100 [Magnetococcales bacterium]|nr:hypothetical protein [Magnetococcales bacterium]
MDWLQIGNNINGELAGDRSASSVSLSNDGLRLAIGTELHDGNGSLSGDVRIYEFSGTDWNQLGVDINGENSSDRSGVSVSLNNNGSRVAIGANQNDGNGSNSGHVRIFEYDGTTWNQLGADIDGENGGDRSGISVSISGDGSRVGIGANENDGNGNNSGHARVYDYNGSSWVQVGADIDGESFNDFSGSSIDLSQDGSRIAIGALFNNGNGSSSGHARVYEFDGSNWVQLGNDFDDDDPNDRNGSSVRLSSDGSIVAVGASGGYSAGYTKIYEWNGVSWIQIGQTIDSDQAYESAGESLSLSNDGTRVAIGYSQGESRDVANGYTRIFDYDGSNWNQVGTDIDGLSAYDESGHRVSLSGSGSRIAISEPGNDENGSNAGNVRVFEFPQITGAGGDPHIKPMYGDTYDLPHKETSYMLLCDTTYKLIITGLCWKLPKSKYLYKLNKLNNNKRTKLKKLLQEATYFKYIKIQINDEVVIYDMDTLEQVQYNPIELKNYNLQKVSKKYNNIIESKIRRAKIGLFGNKMHYTSLKCIEKIINIKLVNNKEINLRIARDRDNLIYRNSISIEKINIPSNDMYGALIRKEIIEVNF